MQKLQACGKCHDWAVVSLYLLSYNKFLIYSVLTPLRWSTWWTTFGINIFVMVLQEPSTYNLMNFFLIVDAIHLSRTIVECSQFE